MTATLVEPAFYSSPPFFETLGPEVADVCEMAGFGPDPEQQLALDAIFGLTQHGTPAADEGAIIAPRQNIKTGLLKQCALGWLFVTEQRLVIWSAHEFSTAQEAHRDLAELVTNTDVLRKRVKRITNGNGDEGIELLTGQRVKFKARTKTGGRGLTGDKVVLDEAFALEPKHMGSLVPTMSARPHGQILYASSAGLADSETLRTIRDRGRPGKDPGLVYIEFVDDLPGECDLGDECTHAVDSPGCRLDDVERWARANSQLGRRIKVKALQRERRALAPEEFARERLGWWDEPEDAAGPELAVPAGLFDTRKDPLSEMLDPIVLGIDVSPARQASLTAAGWRKDGRKHIEVIQTAQGIGWIVDVLTRVIADHDPAALALDELVVGLLGPQLRAAGIEPVTTGRQQMAQASMGLVDDLIEDRIRHRGDAPLAAAANTAVWRTLGDGRAFNRKGGTDISTLVSSALASWLLESIGQPKPPPAGRTLPLPPEPTTTSLSHEPAFAGF